MYCCMVYFVISLESQISSLEEAKKSKEAEIEKYKKYLNKAKKIIESFGGNKGQSSDDNVEVQSLKSTLKEKEKAYERLEVRVPMAKVMNYYN